MKLLHMGQLHRRNCFKKAKPKGPYTIQYVAYIRVTRPCAGRWPKIRASTFSYWQKMSKIVWKRATAALIYYLRLDLAFYLCITIIFNDDIDFAKARWKQGTFRQTVNTEVRVILSQHVVCSERTPRNPMHRHSQIAYIYIFITATDKILTIHEAKRVTIGEL